MSAAQIVVTAAGVALLVLVVWIAVAAVGALKMADAYDADGWVRR